MGESLNDVNSLVDEFETAWTAGRSPRIERFLERIAADRRASLLDRLLRIEVARRRGAGETPTQGEYAARFRADESTIAEVFASVVDLDHGHGGDRDGGLPVDPSAQTQAWVSRDYEVLGFLGAGGMGEVYRARRVDLDRVVAIKVLRTAAGADDLLREARHAARAGDHPNIATVYHVGQHAGRPFIEMQFVDGVSLEQRLGGGPIPWHEACDVVVQAARALEHAKRGGVVHRDVKTSNVMLTTDGVVKVVDFGLAQDLLVNRGPERTLTVSGTPAYMSPEQWEAGDVDWRTDQYSLGVTFFRLLTAEYPFNATSQLGLVEQHCRGPRPSLTDRDPTLPAGLTEVVSRMMAIEPDARFASWREMIAAVERVAEGDAPDADPAGVASPRPTHPARPRLPGLRPPYRTTLIVGLVSLLLVALADWIGAFDRLELAVLDRLQRVFATNAPHDGVACVMIDQESKDRLAPGEPLSRSEHIGRALALVAEAGCPAIGVDVLFVDASPAEDADLAFMTGAFDRIVHAIGLDLAQGFPGRSVAVPEEWTIPVDPGAVPTARRIDLPVIEILENPGGHDVGHVALVVGPDGVIRSIPHLLRIGPHVLPSLSLATAMRQLDVPRENVELEPGRRIVLRSRSGSVHTIPVDADGLTLVDLSRRPSRVPLWTVLDADEETRAEWSHRALFVGSELPGDFDVGPVATSPSLPLVELHAAAHANIVEGRGIVGAGWLVRLAILAIVTTLACVAGGLCARGTGLASMTVLLLAGAAGTAWCYGGQPRLLLPVAAPMVAGLLAFTGTGFARFARIQSRRRELEDLLGRSVSPAIVRRLLNEPERIKEARRRETTILHLRLSKSVRFGQHVEAEEVLELMEPLFDVVTHAILDCGGTIEALTAEGCTAVFGDPEDQPDHVRRAVDCSRRLRGELTALLEAWSRRPGREPVRFGIGIDTGYVTVGHVGNDRWLRYTVVGTAVDEARRLAAAADDDVRLGSRVELLGGASTVGSKVGTRRSSPIPASPEVGGGRAGR